MNEQHAVADAICRLFAERGDERYDEVVSQTTHAVQTAELAEAHGASPPLVAAALLHDIGHLLEPWAIGTQPERDVHHEEVAARVLARWFGPEVTDPIRYHVAAKRYLCAVDTNYLELLSPASVHSLELQGGAMSTDELTRFAQLPSAAEAVRLRRWDDQAKDGERPTAPFNTYRQLLVELVQAAT